ncbi:MAG: TRAM domain-containing protein [Chloroflexi bacterium]|nr:TRAM domain-containing protein [Chloroflexota bacterium]
MTQHPSHDTITIELAAMANGGRALGRVDGQVVFVPYTIPGERVEARIVESRGRALFAEGITLLEASADRVYPECPHFGPGTLRPVPVAAHPLRRAASAQAGRPRRPAHADRRAGRNDT